VIKYEPIRVGCYSSYRAHEKPVSFFFRGCSWEISDIFKGNKPACLGAGHQTGWMAMLAQKELFTREKREHRFL